MRASLISQPKLLVSVRSLVEAESAIAGGADIIDIKEPDAGSLGRASAEVIANIVECPKSLPSEGFTAALGELNEARQWLTEHPDPIQSLEKLRFAKVGFCQERGGDWHRRFVELSDRLAPQTTLIPAAYADADRSQAPPVEAVCELAVTQQCPFLLIDTWKKDGQGLLDWLTAQQLEAISNKCRQHGVGLALAGSLSLEILPHIVPFADVVAVRGAACAGARRNATIETSRVRQLKQLIRSSPTISRATSSTA